MRQILFALFVSVFVVTGVAAQTYGYGSQGYPGYGDYMPPPPPMPSARSAPGGMRFEKGKTDTAYTLRVYTGRRTPSEIEVSSEPGYLVLHSARTDQTDVRRDGSYQYRRSFSRFHRRLPLPQDADPAHLTRTDGDGVIDIMIPRRQ